MIPARWAASMPSAAWATMSAALPGLRTRSRASACPRVSPWSSSITTYGSPLGSVPASKVSTRCGFPARPAADASFRKRRTKIRHHASFRMQKLERPLVARDLVADGVNSPHRSAAKEALDSELSGEQRPGREQRGTVHAVIIGLRESNHCTRVAARCRTRWRSPRRFDRRRTAPPGSSHRAGS